MLTVILFIVLLLLSCLWCFFGECKKPDNYPPGPFWFPFLGSSLELKALAKKIGGQHLAMRKLAEQYVSDIIGLKLGREYVVAACSYNAIKKILTSEEYEGRPDNFFFRMRSMGTRKGITGTDGELWKEQRAFLVAHLKAFGFGKNIVEKMVLEESQDIIKKIEGDSNNVDVGIVLAPSVLNILWQLTSGNNLRGNQRIINLLELLHKRAKAFDMCGGVLNTYPWIRFIAPEKSGYLLLQHINSEIKYFITEAIEDHKAKWEDERSGDVIYAYLKEMKKGKTENKKFFTDDQLVMVCLDIFIAGSTTTTNTVNFALLAMIMFPDVQEKVYQCLKDTFSKNADISYNDRQLVPYIEAVLLECQRYFPVVPIIGPRRVLRKTELGGYDIPKDSTVLTNIYSVHYDKEYWKDPEQFRPERFLDNDGNLVKQDRVLTFGLGKRRCLGEALAKTCIFLFFVTIVRRYKIEAQGDNPTGKIVTGINMTPDRYKAKFICR